MCEVPNLSVGFQPSLVPNREITVNTQGNPTYYNKLLGARDCIIYGMSYLTYDGVHSSSVVAAPWCGGGGMVHFIFRCHSLLHCCLALTCTWKLEGCLPLATMWHMVANEAAAFSVLGFLVTQCHLMLPDLLLLGLAFAPCLLLFRCGGYASPGAWGWLLGYHHGGLPA